MIYKNEEPHYGSHNQTHPENQAQAGSSVASDEKEGHELLWDELEKKMFERAR